jgi:DNA-binding MarR family transcriptional regulator
MLSTEMSSEDGAYDGFLAALTRAYHQFVLRSDALHGDQGISTGLRSMLLLLARGTPMTLPEIARDRAVSRQFIQRLAREMEARGWIALAPNPRHRRSPLLRLTAAGEAAARGVREREAAVATDLASRLRGVDLKGAERALVALSKALATGPGARSAPRAG